MERNMEKQKSSETSHPGRGLAAIPGQERAEAGRWDGGSLLRVFVFWSMPRHIVLLATLLLWSFSSVFSQTDNFTKNFKQFKEPINNIDFYSYSRSDIAPFEKPLQEALKKLAEFLDQELTKGAIVICTTAEQKDSVSEARLLKMGYRWVLIQLTPEAAAQQMMDQVKSQMGGKLPPGMLERIRNQPPEMKAAGIARLVASTVQRAAYAILTTTLNPAKEFRPTRLDDMGRSPLADWLDIGLASYAAGPESYNLRFLQGRLEEAFPLEDMLTMSRPFVPPVSGSGLGGDGGGVVIRRSESGGNGSPGGSQGGSPAPEGAAPQMIVGGTGGGGERRGRDGASMPKDVQDRMTFDAQAASFFSYILQKLGTEKIKMMIRANLEKKETSELLAAKDMLGADWEKTEKEWQSWVREQKAAGPEVMRIQMAPAPSPGKP